MIVTKVLWGWVAWRLWLLLVVAIAVWLVPFRPDFDYVTLDASHWLQTWANFDGVHYLQIASAGYTDQARFLPLFPYLVRGLSLTVGGLSPTNVLLSALVLSNMCNLYSLYLLKKWWDEKFGPEVSTWSVALFLLFPTSFFLWAVYSESLFILLVILTLRSLEKKNWWWSGLWIALASITRLPGVLLVGLYLWQWWQESKKWQDLWPLSIVGLFFGQWLDFVAVKWGNPLYFITAHGQLANSRSTSQIVNPFRTGTRYIKILFSVSPELFEWWASLLEILSVGLVGVGYAWQFLTKKISSLEIVYVELMIFLPVMSGTWSGFPRYALLAFPLIPYFVKKLSLDFRWGIVIASAIIQVMTTLAFARGYFVA